MFDFVSVMSEPASPGPDSDTTMEVDSVNSDSSRGLDDSEEPSTPEDKKIFFIDSPELDRKKDEEPVRTIRYVFTMDSSSGANL